jgi:hypothetical protein
LGGLTSGGIHSGAKPTNDSRTQEVLNLRSQVHIFLHFSPLLSNPNDRKYYISLLQRSVDFWC